MADNSITFLDYFPGNVPPGIIFISNVDDLLRIVTGSQKKSEPNPIAAVSLIGLLAHFEAFCKGQFAALINICPELIRQLALKGLNTCVDAAQLMNFSEFSARHLGFLISESYDFGTAKGINKSYTALLNCSPLSSGEKKRFDRLVDDRNLLVHHGGIFTAKYAGRRIARQQIREKMYVDSLVVAEDDFRSAASFLLGVASKTTKSTAAALRGFMQDNHIESTKLADKAISAMTWA